jgi:peptide/nickel transport system ATP-binding protein
MFSANIKVQLAKKQLLDIEFGVQTSLAIVGESGSGKSLALKSILGLTPNSMDIEFNYSWDYELVRGKSVTLVPQNPFTALSPKSKIANNFFCTNDDSILALEMVGLSGEHLFRYPHELSGGQLQRVCIAIAISHKPKLMLLDEPTTALDSQTKLEICTLIKSLQQAQGFLSIFVSHEIEVASIICDDILVLDNGIVAEYGKFDEFLHSPQSSAGKNLLNSGFKNRNKQQ